MIKEFWKVEVAARGAFLIFYYFAVGGSLLINLLVITIIINPKIAMRFTKWHYEKFAKIPLPESEKQWFKQTRANFSILLIATLSLLILVLKARPHI